MFHNVHVSLLSLHLELTADILQFDGLQQLGIITTVEEFLCEVAFVDCHFGFHPSDWKKVKGGGGKYLFPSKHEAEYDELRMRLVMEALLALPNAAVLITVGADAKHHYRKVLKPALRKYLPAGRLNENTGELRLQHLLPATPFAKSQGLCHAETIVANRLYPGHAEDWSMVLVVIASFSLCSKQPLEQNLAILANAAVPGTRPLSHISAASSTWPSASLHYP